MTWEKRPISRTIPTAFKVPTTVPIWLNGNYVAPQQNDLASGIAKLILYGVNLAVTDPKKAEEFGKACLAIGIFGAGIWLLAKSFS